MRSFTINQTIHSEKDLGLRVTKPPAIPSSQQVVDHLEVLGREGTLTRLQGWEDQELGFQVAVQGHDLTSQYRTAAAALMGAQTVELSASPGVFYQVKNTVVSGLQQVLTTMGVFDVQMRLAPFAYLKNSPTTSFTDRKNLVNPGSVYSLLVITVEGTGTHTLTINGQVFTIKNPTGLVTIDSVLRVCRVGTKAGIDAVTPDYPVLAVGANTIKASSGVTKVTVQLNWRML